MSALAANSIATAFFSAPDSVGDSGAITPASASAVAPETLEGGAPASFATATWAAPSTRTAQTGIVIFIAVLLFRQGVAARCAQPKTDFPSGGGPWSQKSAALPMEQGEARIDDGL